MYHPSYQIDLELLNRFAPNKKLHIIDYGCGNGTLLNLLPKSRVASYYGFDVNQDGIRVGQTLHKGKNIHFSVIKPNHVPQLGKAGSADVVILIGVLQYLSPAETQQVIKAASQVLRTGGIFLTSCVTDHWLYRQLNLYRFFFPNTYVNRLKLIRQLRRARLTIRFQREMGLIIGPLFSHGLVIPFDALDKILFQTKGKLGPIGISARKAFQPLMMLEYKIPIDLGYTLFVVAQK